MTISCITTTAHGAHHLLPAKRHLRMQYSERRHQQPAGELLLRTSLFTNGARFTFECVQQYHLRMCNPHARQERVYQVHLSVKVWAVVVRAIVMGLCLIADRLTDSTTSPRF